MTRSNPLKQKLRVLKFLNSHGRVSVAEFGDSAIARCVPLGASGKGRSEKLVCARAILFELQRETLVAGDDKVCRISALGRKFLARQGNTQPDDSNSAFQSQHQKRTTRAVHIHGQWQSACVNSNESPLARLKSKKCADGYPWISDAAYSAGEQLRRDFTKGNLMQKISANWDGAMGGGNRSFGAGGKVDVTDASIDARDRMHRALTHVGPDLAGVLTDVCCFLKGLETVEREHRWPPRSAKLMLRVGLGLLAQFYGFDAPPTQMGRIRSC